MKNKRITQEDLQILLSALETINIEKYNIAIELVEPIDSYILLATQAPTFIIEHLSKIIEND